MIVAEEEKSFMTDLVCFNFRAKKMKTNNMYILKCLF